MRVVVVVVVARGDIESVLACAAFSRKNFLRRPKVGAREPSVYPEDLSEPRLDATGFHAQQPQAAKARGS